MLFILDEIMKHFPIIILSGTYTFCKELDDRGVIHLPIVDKFSSLNCHLNQESNYPLMYRTWDGRCSSIVVFVTPRCCLYNSDSETTIMLPGAQGVCDKILFINLIASLERHKDHYHFLGRAMLNHTNDYKEFLSC